MYNYICFTWHTTAHTTSHTTAHTTAHTTSIELKRNIVVILNIWQRKPMLYVYALHKPMRKAEIKNKPSCGDQILKYNHNFLYY